MRFKQYEKDIFLLELVNTVESTHTDESTDREYKGIKKYHEQASDDLIQLFDELEDFIFSLGDDVQKKELKHYYAYKRIQNFVCLGFQTQENRLKLHSELISGIYSPKNIVFLYISDR